MGTYYVQQGQVVAFIGILVGLLCVVGAKISFLDGVQQDPGGSAVSVRDGKSEIFYYLLLQLKLINNH